ncbi:MAG: RIP metalloprotease RseP [Defluviitaleaceae bacterium]|nr:RIP metalloprotease RseP [Defluviitaleaceae bacterium]
MGLIVALLVFGVLVIVHEYGHYIVAVKNGIAVEEFAIGMGPLIWSKQKNETLFTIRLLPLGGYCKMKGMEPEEDENSEEAIQPKDDTSSYRSKTVWQRISVIFAGSFFNLLLLALIMLILTSVNGFTSLTVASLTENMPAAEAGILEGDTIVSIDGRAMRIFADAPRALRNNGETPIEVIINRGNERISKTITPMLVNNSYFIGFSPLNYNGLFGGDESIPNANLFQVLFSSFWESVGFVRIIGDGLMNLLTTSFSLNNFGGIVHIVDVVGNVYEAGIYQGPWQAISGVLMLTALLSANLAVFNLLPVPPLDGGRLVFLFIEAIRGKPVSPEKEGFVTLIGVVLLVLLFIAVFFNDILRLFN